MGTENPHLITSCVELQEKRFHKALRACFIFNCPLQVDEGNVFPEDETVHFIDNSYAACEVLNEQYYRSKR